ncbi:MAG: hypothetical protein ACI4JY_04720, partial [Oscillospiraceae bacterium]
VFSWRLGVGWLRFILANIAKWKIDGKSQFTSLKLSVFCIRTIILHRKLTKIEREMTLSSRIYRQK